MSKHQMFPSKKVLTWGLVAILLGLVLILGSLVIEEKAKPVSNIDLIGIKFLEHMGIALMTIGIVGIIVDFPDWQKYFQERIAETIIQRRYLDTLEKSELIDLQTNTLKAYFSLDEIDRKGSLLEFFHEKVHSYLGLPYREDVSCTLSINPTAGGTRYAVEDVVSYSCRKVGDYIQDQIRWTADRDEIESLDEFKILIKIPQNFFQSPEFKTKYPSMKAEVTFDMNKEEDQVLQKNPDGTGFTLPLLDFREIDDLYVKISVKYTIVAGRMLQWTMTHPSKHVTGVVHYPPDFKLHVDAYGITRAELEEHPTAKEEHPTPGLYTFSYKSWLLPYSGFAFAFRAPVESSAKMHPADDIV
jgi:hypothetical protein